jgi:hypothetical protein
MCKGDNNYGVLNDFDLSTIMEPNARNPNRQGLERTGTLPFMAMELLKEKGFNGNIPRRYDHELESFAWVLVWVSRCILGGEESELPPQLKEWLSNDNRKVGMSKTYYVLEQSSIPTTSDYTSFSMVTFLWTRIWDKYFRQRQDQEVEEPETFFVEKTNSEYLQELIEACTKCAEKNPIASVPIDVAWVKGLADLKFTSPAAIEDDEHPPLQRSGDGSSPSDGGDQDMFDDDDMYEDDELISIPNESDVYDTDDDGRSARTDELHSEGDGA